MKTGFVAIPPLVWLGSLLLSGCGGEEPHAVGQLAWDRLELVAEVGEPIVAMPVAEGAKVEAGTLLVRQDGSRAEAQLQEAEAARRQAAARVAELERGTRGERIREARAQLAAREAAAQAAAKELERVRRLAADRLISEESVDRAEAERDRSRAEREAAQARLEELLSGVTDEELKQAREALARAEAAERLARIALDRLSIQAPRPGRVDTLPFEVGERPQPGAVVAVLLVGEAPYARVYVPEPVRARLAPGTPAEVKVDGIEQPFAARVRHLSNDPVFTPYLALTEHDRQRLSYLAEVVLTDAPATLAAGVPVEVTFRPAAAPR